MHVGFEGVLGLAAVYYCRGLLTSPSAGRLPPRKGKAGISVRMHLKVGWVSPERGKAPWGRVTWRYITSRSNKVGGTVRYSLTQRESLGAKELDLARLRPEEVARL